MATVADAEEVGVSMAWQYCDTVALDSLGVIRRIHELMYPPPPWTVDRGETSGANGREADTVDVNTRASRRGG